ncbi:MULTISPECIES: hypothetical protein [unclassified Nonomuraea]|uniref:hypothetical protein n=1 Tax=unclassified Nonomuraea TaxID=2593643 RepID=UPI0033C3E24B
MPRILKRGATRLAVVAAAAVTIATGPAVVAHAQGPIVTVSVIVHSIESLEDLQNSMPLAGVAIQATSAAGNAEDECVTNTNGQCNLGLTSGSEHTVCITDVPEIYDREPGACNTAFIEAGRINIFTFFLAPRADNEDGDDDGDGNDNGNGDGDDSGNGNGSGDDVVNSGSNDNIVNGSGQNCSVTNFGAPLLSILSPITNHCVNAPGRTAD